MNFSSPFWSFRGEIRPDDGLIYTAYMQSPNFVILNLSASEMTYIVSSGALNSTHSLTRRLRVSSIFKQQTTILLEGWHLRLRFFIFVLFYSRHEWYKHERLKKFHVINHGIYRLAADSKSCIVGKFPSANSAQISALSMLSPLQHAASTHLLTLFRPNSDLRGSSSPG